MPISHSLPLHGELPAPAAPPVVALAAKGFRPFFLLAALFAVAIVPVWLLVFGGVLRPGAYLDATTWHAHEMIFGFAVAVIAGFLLTAVGNWTQRETLVGTPLLALAALWVLGRIAMAFAGLLPRALPALVDLAFLPLLVTALARPLVTAGNRRNFVMLAILGALFAANVAVHLEALGLLGPGAGRRACSVAIDVVILMSLVIAGRVFPMFTRNGTGVQTIRNIPALDLATIVAMAALVLVDAALPSSKLAAVGAGVVSVLAVARAAHWGSQHTLRRPLLWILHAGYAWVALGLLLRAVAGFDHAVSASLATHALTVGAIGSLTLGMMARVSLGHSGRALVPSPAVAVSFALLSGAAVARVVVPLLAPGAYFIALLAAGALWTLAFLLFLVVYAPVLARPREDGKPG